MDHFMLCCQEIVELSMKIGEIRTEWGVQHEKLGLKRFVFASQIPIPNTAGKITPSRYSAPN